MMRKTTRQRLLLATVLFLCSAFLLQAQNTVSGIVKDESSGEKLIGVNVVIGGSTEGTITDVDGAFSINSKQAFPWTLVISYVGYNEQRLQVEGSNTNLEIALESGLMLSDEVVVSASRRREKIQEAPASISVLSAKKLEVSGQAVDPMRNLINTPGVQLQQQSAGRINIEMRGTASLFNTAVFPIMDYRSLSSPGVGTFNSNGINNIDLARIEVVRGAGSALYGPGVSSGVIHFITKNPIDYPGTTIELLGGTMSTGGVSVRHAGRNAKKTFGYKINAAIKRGDEFTLDLIEDAAQIARQQTSVSNPVVSNGVVDVTQPGEILLTQDDLDPDGDGNMMQNFWDSKSINATLEFRPQDDLSVFLSGGYNLNSSVFYNSQGEGLSQSGITWGQARMQKGGLFAQVFMVHDDGGPKNRPTFLYQTGLRTSISRVQREGQVQYNFDAPKVLNANFTVGVDFRNASSDSENLVYGRNEDDDDYTIFGGYAQGKFELGEKLDLVLAGRYDQFNFIDEGAFSPRAALVYKPNPLHTFRATYNNASIPATALNVNIDFPVSSPVPGLFDIWLTGQKEAHTYNNPVIDITAPGVPDLPWGTPGLPLAIPYALVNQATQDALIPGLEMAFPDLAPLLPAISAFLNDPANTPSGVTGTFAPYNIFTGQPMPELVPTESSSISTLNSFELGYKGLIKNKLGVTVDLYTIERKGFFQFTAVGPTIALAGADFATDLGTAVSGGIEPFLVDQLTGAGVENPEATAAALAGAIGDAYGAGGGAAEAQFAPLFNIFGTVESDLLPQDDGIAHVAAGYRTFADAAFNYWGSDIGLEYYFNQDFTAFANYSHLSQNRWVPGEADDDGLPFPWALNSPKNKYRLGLRLAPDQGFRGSLSFQHDDSFYAEFGQYAGETDAKNLIDLSVGYKFDNGLSLDLTGNNIFNNKYRAFPNFPQIGRLLVARAVYSFGGDK
ncbi:MAG: TonB-dependent receptor domain-containing protein [Chitinophagales bacterium]